MTYVTSSGLAVILFFSMWVPFASSIVQRRLVTVTRVLTPMSSFIPTMLTSSFSTKRIPQKNTTPRRRMSQNDDFFADFDEWEKENKATTKDVNNDRFSNSSNMGRNNFQRKNDYSSHSSRDDRSRPRPFRQDRNRSSFREDRNRDDVRTTRRSPSGAGYVIEGGDSNYNSYNNARRPRNNENFRDNFTGTRVFVQNLPTDCTWQQLKDHFRVAGSVVFASVSTDFTTRTSKGCGIVQFETTDMAQNAINIMKDHPLQGMDLFVREDRQEQRNGDGARNDKRPVTTWKCADEENAAFLSAEVRSNVEKLISSRDQARRQRDYQTSDEIRDELKKKYNVHVDDKLKAWWYSVDDAVPKPVIEQKGDGRWGDKKNLKAWRQIPTTPESDACVDANLVNGLLTQRDIARKERNFSLADTLLEQARTSPDNSLTLRIHDESRTWRIWTDEAPPKEIYEKKTMRKNVNRDVAETANAAPSILNEDDTISSHTSDSIKPTATDLCIQLLEKYDPSKIDEVKKLLESFPGREGNILQRLKQNFNVADD